MTSLNPLPILRESARAVALASVLVLVSSSATSAPDPHARAEKHGDAPTGYVASEQSADTGTAHEHSGHAVTESTDTGRATTGHEHPGHGDAAPALSGHGHTASAHNGHAGADHAPTQHVHSGHAGVNATDHAGDLATSKPPLKLTPEQEALLGLKTLRLRPRRVSVPLRFIAEIKPREDRIFPLVAGAQGFIAETGKYSPGMTVPRDGLLGRFSSAELQGPVQAYLVTLDTVAKQGATVSAGTVPADAAEQQRHYYAVNERLAADRLHTLGMSPQQVRRLAKTRETPILFDIRAPASSVLMTLDVFPGQRFSKGHEWARLVAVDELWAEAVVQPADLWQFVAGTRVLLETPGAAARLDGRVSAVPPMAEGTAGALRVRIEVPNPGNILRPGMQVTGVVHARSPKALMVPLDVLQMGERDGTARVFLALGDGRYALQRVRVGRFFGPWVEIVSGLAPGATLVREGGFMLDAEQRLRAQPAAAHAHHAHHGS